MSASRSRTGWGTAVVLPCLLVFAAGCQHSGSPAPVQQPDAAASPERAAAGATGHTAESEELSQTRVALAEELLEGRFAGVRVIRRANGISVQIRGASSILGGNEPLYVVDGMQLPAGPGGALTGINPMDIERIEVLKDIGSTSFYGVRGANGVVLITTKRGN